MPVVLAADGSVTRLILYGAPKHQAVMRDRPWLGMHVRADGPLTRPATLTAAFQPGARPPAGERRPSVSTPLRASTQAMTEFEFHISPAPSSSLPQVGVGTDGKVSTTRLACPGSSVRRTGPDAALARSGMDP